MRRRLRLLACRLGRHGETTTFIDEIDLSRLRQIFVSPTRGSITFPITRQHVECQRCGRTLSERSEQ